ncbi:MAG: ArsR family transcriptional regulator [Methanobacterium sp. ERen5]|nr:MAG: ArsR family transcriptional regulator [Methanobacterium sp. ERen5]
MTGTKKYSNNKNSRSYKIFSSKKHVDVVKGQVKVKILDALCKKNMSFNEIVELTCKAKPTVSQHLSELVTNGLIVSIKDPNDKRRKIFSINAEFLGELSSDNETKFDIEEYFSNISNSSDPFDFYRLILRAVRTEFWNDGINIDPILHKAGIRVGNVFYNELQGEDLESFLRNIEKFWEEKHLGRVEVKTLDPVVICVYDCFECKDLPEIGEPACSFDSGLLDALFSKHFDKNVATIETTCFAMGDECCTFVIN